MKEVIASTITRVILFLVVGGLGGACLAYPTPRVVVPEPVVMSKRMTERDWVDGGGRRAQA